MRLDERSTGELIHESIEHVREIFRNEIRLAKAETKEEAAKAGKGAFLAVAAILFGVFALHFLLWTVVWALAPNMENWLASLIVAGGTLLLAVGLGMAARSTFKSVNPKPERAKRQMEETVQWATKQHT